jgi:peptidoglycan/xylan/chitin deacetylase (PgdA/CDA1 family)
VILRRIQEGLFPGTIVFLYHRVARVGEDPFSLAVPPVVFAQHLEVIRRHLTPIRLQDLVRALRDRRVPRRAAVVTFDDGYADNLYAAKPLLERFDVPATVFVTPNDDRSERGFWWDRLVAILGAPAPAGQRLSLALPDGSVALEVGPKPPWEGGANPRRRVAFDRLYRRLRALDEVAREDALARLSRLCAPHGGAGDPTHWPAPRLRADEIAALAADGLVEIGAHSLTHPVLSELPEPNQREEIEGARRKLEAILTTKVKSFAYPFGFRGSYTRATMELVRRAGYSSAATTEPGRISRRTSLMSLPRLQVFGWSAAELEKAIGR